MAYHHSLLLGLDKGSAAGVGPLELLVSACPAVAVLLESVGVPGKCVLRNLELLLAVVQGLEGVLHRRLVSVVGLHGGLEVKPVLGGRSVVFLRRDRSVTEPH